MDHDEIEKAIEATVFELELNYSDFVKCQEHSSALQDLLVSADAIYQQARNNLMYLKKDAQVISIEEYSKIRAAYDISATKRIDVDDQLSIAAAELVRLKKVIAKSEKSLQDLKVALYSTPKKVASTAKILEFPYGNRRRDTQ
jgi:hypothetical protein